MDISISVPKLPEIIERMRLVPKGAKTAISRAINDALRKGRTESVRAIRERYAVKAGDVRDQIKVYRSDAGNLLGFISATGYKFPLELFMKSFSREEGLVIEEVKGKQTRIEHAFSAQMQSGHEGVFTRYLHGQASRRLPIHEMFGLSVPQMMSQRTEVLPKIEAAVQAQLETRLEQVQATISTARMRLKLPV
jgi:hypothetical protein